MDAFERVFLRKAEPKMKSVNFRAYVIGFAVLVTLPLLDTVEDL